MRQTIKQFIASVNRCNPPADTEWQINAWPYPQAKDSHIAIYRSSWSCDSGYLPYRRIIVPLVNSDIPGALMRVAETAPHPRKVVEELKEMALP